MRTCANCRFMGDGPPTHCRRSPPHAVTAASSSFPVVLPAWSCSMHRFSWRRLLRSWFKPTSNTEPR